MILQKLKGPDNKKFMHILFADLNAKKCNVHIDWFSKKSSFYNSDKFIYGDYHNLLECSDIDSATNTAITQHLSDLINTEKIRPASTFLTLCAIICSQYFRNPLQQFIKFIFTVDIKLIVNKYCEIDRILTHLIKEKFAVDFNIFQYLMDLKPKNKVNYNNIFKSAIVSENIRDKKSKHIHAIIDTGFVDITKEDLNIIFSNKKLSSCLNNSVIEKIFIYYANKNQNQDYIVKGEFLIGFLSYSQIYLSNTNIFKELISLLSHIDHSCEHTIIQLILLSFIVEYILSKQISAKRSSNILAFKNNKKKFYNGTIFARFVCTLVDNTKFFRTQKDLEKNIPLLNKSCENLDFRYRQYLPKYIFEDGGLTNQFIFKTQTLLSLSKYVEIHDKNYTQSTKVFYSLINK